MRIKPIEINGDLVLSLAASVSAVLNCNEESFDYYINIKDEEILHKCAKANRRTLLHNYIEYVFCEQMNYTMRKHFDKEAIDEMRAWLDSLNISYNSIKDAEDNDEDLERYADEMQDFFNEKALSIISNAVFSILFQDKDFCYKFNLKLSEQIKKLKISEYPDFLQEDGYLNRETPPTWLKEGVFYRDKGRCQACGADLTKLFVIANVANYDHVIPLRIGGSNDPTNYQLMCEHCNKSKNARTSQYRNLIWPMWSDDE